MTTATRPRALAALTAIAALGLASCGGSSVATTPTAAASGSAPTATGDGSTAAHPARLRIPSGDWTTFAYNAERTGTGPANTGITAATLPLLQRRTVHLDGTVDSAPIELHAIRVAGRVRDVIVVTTSYGRTIALDARTGAKLWEVAPADVGRLQGSSQITTATPVADPNRRFVYAASPNGYVHKIAVAGGHEVRSGGWPVRVTFDATREKLAGALNLSGSSLVVVTGGYYGDAPAYQGHVVLIDRATGRITRVWNSLCSNRTQLIRPPSSCAASDSAIWGRSGSVVEPGTGRILVATGNAPFNGSTNWGDSVLELSPQLRLLHNWTPVNQAQLNGSDQDLGSTEPALLPAIGGRRLAVQGGKDGILRLLDLGALDGTTGGPGPRTGGELQRIAAPGGTDVFSAPAVWTNGGRTYVFVADGAGTTGYAVDGGRLQVAWEKGTPGTSPVVAGGLLYVYDENDGVLVIRDPASGRELDTLPAASGHWNSPIVVGGRIILPEGDDNDHSTSGTLDIYHLPGR
jgi:outer membrane protein assembly factor BamB